MSQTSPCASRILLRSGWHADRFQAGLGELRQRHASANGPRGTSTDLVATYIGHGAPLLIARAFGPEATDDQRRTGLSLFFAHYQLHKLDATRPYPGAIEALDALAAYPMSVLTNKPTNMSVDILQGLGLAKYFRSIYGGDSLEKKKPDPTGALKILGEFGVSQAYIDEYTAFHKYARRHKDCVFLVDTYDTLRSGVPNAIKVAKELGDRINFIGIRLDSGDLAYLSKEARKMLDDAGFPNAKIIASNDLDEYTIINLKQQGAKIDSWGIGTKLITGFDQPALGAVYKIVSIEDEEGNMVDTIKISANPEKVSTPG